MSIKSLVIIGSLALCSVSSGQTETSIGGPTLGYALDPSVHALRPILGIAGASVLGDSLDSGFAIRDAVIDGPRGYALAIDSASRAAWLIRPNQSTPAAQIPVAGEVAAVYLSPQASAAALQMQDGRIEVVTGLSTAAFVVTDLPTGQRLNRRPQALAVSDDGNFVVAAFDETQALLLGLDGTRAPLAIGRTTALAFRPSSSDILGAGPGNRVWLIKQSPTGPILKQIAGAGDGISTPAAVTFAPSGTSALIANSGNATIVAVDLAAGVVSSTGCGCNPVRFERLTTGGLFRLNDPSDQPMYLFDAASSRALFVPPLPTANQPQGQQN
ncbi:MAG TPA: hypothetical protein VGG72_05580 [Bryobacteraceae bacterium]|jgi:hypothetical protein